MEAIATIAAIVGLIWGAILFLRGGLLGGCLAVMLATTCFSVDFFKVPLGALPLTADRILLLVLIAQYLLWRHWRLADAQPLGPPEFLLGGFTAYLLLSTFSGDWRVRNCQPASWLIVYYLMPLAVYWIVRQSRLSERSVRVLFGCVTLFGVYLAITALAEYYQLWSFVFPKYIVATALDDKFEFVGRGRGPLLNPIGNGLLLAACLGATLTWWPRLGRPGKLLLMLVAMLLLAGIYCSLTRSVWMGGALALAIVVGVGVPKDWRLPLLGGGLLIAVAVAATNWDRIVAFKRDRNLTAQETADSVHLRPILAVVTWHMFLDRPLFGCGYAQYETEQLNYLSDRSSDLPLEKARGYIPHNVFFSLLAQTGLVGLTLFLAIVALWARDAWRLWRQPQSPPWARQVAMFFLVTLSAYVLNGMFHDVSVVPMANMALYFVAGVTAGLRPLVHPAEMWATASAQTGLAAGTPLSLWERGRG